ncbi:MAG: hypothetical protein K0S47_3978 [Herbinix sp.]|jgi:hypothetical protein|nr:hypothetical protein [Herbinix sp.]
MTEQEKEIATIKERTFKLKLSDADVKRIYKKSGEVGLTVSELLENFIGDLVCGTYSNGSDERDKADEWFNRCWFGMFPDKTFLGYLIGEWQLDNVLELWDDIKTNKEELEYSETHKDEFDDDEIEALKEDLKCWQEELDEIFSDFKKCAKDEETGTLEEELEKIIKWNDEMNAMSTDLQD